MASRIRSVCRQISESVEDVNVPATILLHVMLRAVEFIGGYLLSILALVLSLILLPSWKEMGLTEEQATRLLDGITTFEPLIWETVHTMGVISGLLFMSFMVLLSRPLSPVIPKL